MREERSGVFLIDQGKSYFSDKELWVSLDLTMRRCGV